MDGEKVSARGALAAVVSNTRLILAAQFVVALITLLAAGAAAFGLYSLDKARNKFAAERDAALHDVQVKKGELDARKKEVLALVDALDQFQIGVEAARDQRPDAALYFERASRAVKDTNPVFLRALAKEQFRQSGSLAEAVIAARKLAALGKASDLTPDDYALIARIYCRNKDLAEAETTLKSAPDAVVQAIAVSKDAALRAPLLRDCNSSRIYALFKPSVDAAAPEAFKIQIIYLHISADEDRPAAMALQKSLQGLGYDVPGVETIAGGYPKRGELRFYYEVQRAQATTIADATTSFLKTSDREPWRTAAIAPQSMEGRYSNLPTDRLEIWLPPSAPATSKGPPMVPKPLRSSSRQL